MQCRFSFLKEKTLNSKKFIEFLMLAIGCTVFICVIDFLLILISGFIVTGKIQTDINSSVSIRDVILIFSIPSIVSYIILPTFLIKKMNFAPEFYLKMRPELSKSGIVVKMITTIFLITSIVNLFKHMGKQEAMFVMVTFIFVAVTEEYYVRGIVMNIFRYKYKDWIAIMLSSLIFVFILHSGGNIYTNVIIRLPVSILISIAYTKSGDLYSSIFLHLGYDLLVNTV